MTGAAKRKVEISASSSQNMILAGAVLSTAFRLVLHTADVGNENFVSRDDDSSSKEYGRKRYYLDTEC